MIHVERFRPEHAEAMAISQIGARDLEWHDRRKILQAYADGLEGFTVRDGDGRVLFCGGHVERHPQYATLWAVYAEGIGPRSWGWLLERTRRYILELPHRRVDAMVAPGTAAGRWAKRCGLRPETTLMAAAPDGGDMLIYRRMG